MGKPYSTEPWWPKPKPGESGAAYYSRVGRWLKTKAGRRAAQRHKGRRRR